MPYKIEKQNDQFCVVKETTGATVKCHPTQKEAEDHMAALYANVEDAARKGAGLLPDKKDE